MYKQLTFIIIFILGMTVVSVTQNTVGLLSYDATATNEGYNLVFPHNQSTVFLLNNCGEIVHQWLDDEPTVPGNIAYLLENGDLVKAKRLGMSAVGDPIWAGGGGETVEVRTWDNELRASYTLNNELFRLHHDIAPLPNGNILLIAWENKSGIEAALAGRDTSLLSQGKVWSERILEWNPTTDEIVWEWSVWDHLIQDFHPLRENYGVVEAHPERIDVNYDNHDGHPDWLHINSIDYNERLDQIMLSVPYFDEIWIIDHSTTTEEAKGHVGGNSGRGGDLLFRWGNPTTYRATGERQIFFAHDVQWIDNFLRSDAPNFGDIMIFNNRVPGNFSTVNIIEPTVDATTGQYTMQGDSIFLPQTFKQTITHPDTFSLYSTGLSSAQQLPNGNILTLAGRTGNAFEINPITNEVVWNYRVPLRGGAPVPQGTILEGNNNTTFRFKRYPTAYAAFQDKDLTPKGYIELMPNTEFCNLSVNIESVSLAEVAINIYPNPATDYLIIEKATNEINRLFLLDITGRILQEIPLSSTKTLVNTSRLNSGLYFLKAENGAIDKLIITK